MMREMKLLYLLRHGKSSWADAELDDYDRPLAARGRKATRLLARHIRRAGIRPAVVLCSSARRTRQTLRLLKPGLGNKPERHIEDSLYGADAAALLRRLRALPKRADSVLLIGHNPGLQDLALALARPGKARERMQQRFPTGALATLRIDKAGWRKLGKGDAALVGYLTPQELR
mgnify:CR=1 FL=1